MDNKEFFLAGNNWKEVKDVNLTLNENELKKDSVLYKILKKRKIKDINKFLSPSLDHLHDPYLFRDMERVVDKLFCAIKDKKRILIYGDYDADGITSTTLLYKTLKVIDSSANISYYIPHRVYDGYGLTMDTAKKLADKCDLLITVDCGITSVDETDYLISNGVDVIITDHHLPHSSLPNTLILDAKVEGETYPFKELAGVGVAFKIAQALLKDDVFNYKELMVLASIGTISDIVSLTDENRVITKIGLDYLAEDEFIGIDSLISMSKINKEKITSKDISYKISPKINAAGRVDNPLVSLDLLLSKTKEEADLIAKKLIDINSERRRIEDNILSSINRDIKSNKISVDNEVLVFYGKDWHLGVLGIVSAKLSEQYLKPVIILSESDGILQGSSRAYGNFDLFSAIEVNKDLMIRYGGHKKAVGLTLDIKNLEEFILRINKYAENIMSENMFVEPIYYDIEINNRLISFETLEDLKLLEPFGHENPEPIFLIRNCKSQTVYTMGINNRHIKINTVKDNKIYDLLWFNGNTTTNNIKSKIRFDAIISMAENDYKNNITISLIVRSLRSINPNCYIGSRIYKNYVKSYISALYSNYEFFMSENNFDGIKYDDNYDKIKIEKIYNADSKKTLIFIDSFNILLDILFYTYHYEHKFNPNINSENLISFHHNNVTDSDSLIDIVIHPVYNEIDYGRYDNIYILNSDKKIFGDSYKRYLIDNDVEFSDYIYDYLVIDEEDTIFEDININRNIIKRVYKYILSNDIKNLKQIYKGLNMDILKSAMVIKLLEYLNLISIKYFKDDDIFSDIKITINNSSKLNLEDYKIYNILNEC